MARTPFGGKSRDTGSQPVYTPPTTASGSGVTAGGLTAFIDQGSEFEGKLSFKDTVRIDGRFRGEISSENTLIVGESGEIDASIRSQNVVVSGTVVGNVSASAKVVLHKTARINGDVETACLVVEDGAVLNGQVKMGKNGGGSLKAIEGGGKENVAK
ncbi:MAG TPA: polymer-forming cytoskeletal protein [Myxococcota bacterium]